MTAKIARFIGIFMTLLVLSTSSGLHYTHDITHSHHDCHSNHDDHQAADECALCWFVYHQVAPHFIADGVLPDLTILDCEILLNARYLFASQDRADGLQCNRGPPAYI